MRPCQNVNRDDIECTHPVHYRIYSFTDEHHEIDLCTTHAREAFNEDDMYITRVENVRGY